MLSSTLARLVATAFLLAGVAGVHPAGARELELRPERSPVARRPLHGRALSYYSYCLSQQAMLVRDYRSAASHLETALGADPESPQLHMELARVYLNLTQVDEALGQARQAARLSPQDAEPRRFIVDLFRLELSRNDSPSPRLLEEALAAHQSLLEVVPGDGEARVSMARIYYSQGDYAQAAAVLRPHVQSSPEDTDAIFLMASSLSRSGSPEKARDILESAVATQPEAPELRAALAEAREQAGDPEGARDLMLDLVEEFPSRPDYRFALARLHEQLGDHKAAAGQAQFLVEQFGDAQPGTRGEADLRAAMMFLAETVAGEGDRDRALEITLKAERRFPDETRFSLKRAELLYLLSRDDEADALLEGLAAGQERAVPRSRLSMVLLRAGAAMEQDGEYRRAEELLRKSIGHDSGNHAALNYLGYMLADHEKDLDEALELIRRALALDESNGAYLDSLGWTLFRKGLLEEAEEPLQRAAEAIPEEAVVHDHLGDLYHAQGRLQEAIRAWEKAIHLGIGDAPRVESKIREAEGDPKVQ